MWKVHSVFYEEGGVKWVGWACEDAGREGGMEVGKGYGGEGQCRMVGTPDN